MPSTLSLATAIGFGAAGGALCTWLILKDAKASSSAKFFKEAGAKQLEKVKSSSQPDSFAPALNKLIKTLWPRIGTYVKNLIYDSIEPSINEALPGLVREAGGVKFTRVDLGDSTPQIGPFIVNSSSGSIKMTVGMDIDMDLKVEMTAMGIPIGITGVVVKGLLTNFMSPLMMEPPFFGSLGLYFANLPSVDIRFGGAARIMEIPGLRGALFQAIDNALAGICVLPGRIAMDLNLEDDTDFIDIKYPPPIGVLRLTLWSASNLIAKDMAGLFSAASSDPYVVASLGLQSWTSPTVKKNLNPVWGDGKGLTTDFPVYDTDQRLLLKVFDSDLLGSDDLIGKAQQLAVQELLMPERYGQALSVSLQNDNGESGAGTLTISATFFTLESRHPAWIAEPSEANLSAKILTIKGLPHHAAYPFTVCAQVVRQEPGSSDHDVLVERSTDASQAPPQKHLTDELQTIAINLADRGEKPVDIAKILDVDLHLVKHFLKAYDVHDEQELKEQEAARLVCMSVKKPRFDQTLQMLLPFHSANNRSNVVLKVVDKQKRTIATARVPMQKVLEAEDLQLEGPFTTDVSGLKVFGSLCLRWLNPAD